MTEVGEKNDTDLREEIYRIVTAMEQQHGVSPHFALTKDKIPYGDDGKKTSYEVKAKIEHVTTAHSNGYDVAILPKSVGVVVADVDCNSNDDREALEREAEKRFGDVWNYPLKIMPSKSKGHEHRYYRQIETSKTQSIIYHPNKKTNKKIQSGEKSKGRVILCELIHDKKVITINGGLKELRDLLRAIADALSEKGFNMFAYKPSDCGVVEEGVLDTGKVRQTFVRMLQYQEEINTGEAVELLHKMIGARGYITVIASPRGQGKSSLVAAAFAELTRQGHCVIWFSQDENIKTTMERFRACNADASKIILYAPRGRQPPLMGELKKTIKENDAVALMMDTGDKFVKAAYSDRDLPRSWVNDQNVVDEVMTDLRHLAEEYNVLPIYCTHTRKATSEGEKKQPDEDSISGSHKIGANSDYCLTLRGVKNDDGKVIATDVWQDRVRIHGADVWQSRVTISAEGEITESEIPPPEETRGRKAGMGFNDRATAVIKYVAERESTDCKSVTMIRNNLKSMRGGENKGWEIAIKYLIKKRILINPYGAFSIADNMTTESAIAKFTEIQSEKYDA